MLQAASKVSVKGDFTRGTVVLRNSPYKLSQRDGAWYITESYLTGKPQEHRVDYTLGNRRIQHYLTTLPSGRIIVLPPSWDVLRKQWFHNFDIGDPDETSSSVLFAIIWIFTARPRPRLAPSGLFLIIYGVVRFVIEFVRVPDEHIGYLAGGWLTEGQVLSFPMVLAGHRLMAYAYRARSPSGNFVAAQ